jgi:hypothetical protein
MAEFRILGALDSFLSTYFFMFDIINIWKCVSSEQKAHMISTLQKFQISKISWPPKNLTCWKKKLKIHGEKRNQYLIKNSKITRKSIYLWYRLVKLRKKIFSIIYC